MVVRTDRTALRLADLTRYFGQKRAVDAVDLDVQFGEIFGLLGPNGAGKTTTLKMIVGLLRPSHGTVYVLGHDIQRAPREAKAQLGFVADEPFLPGNLNTMEFLELVCALWSVPRREGERRAERLLKLFDLWDTRGNMIGTFSRGMRRKLSLAGALIHDPQVLILDDLTEGLDPPSVRMTRDLLRELANRGKAVLISTHILQIAERFCDQVGIMDQGRLVAVGSVQELLTEQRAVGLEDLFMKLVGRDKSQEIAAFLEESW